MRMGTVQAEVPKDACPLCHSAFCEPQAQARNPVILGPSVGDG